MKRFIRNFILIGIFILAGCSISKQPCPSENGYYNVILRNGTRVEVFIEKDWFNKHPNAWVTEEQYNILKELHKDIDKLNENKKGIKFNLRFNVM